MYEQTLPHETLEQQHSLQVVFVLVLYFSTLINKLLIVCSRLRNRPQITWHAEGKQTSSSQPRLRRFYLL